MFTATQTFYRAATTPTTNSRRTLSVGPGLAFYRDEYEPRQDSTSQRRPPDAPNYFFSSFVDRSPQTEEPIERGRDRTRRRLSADSTYFGRDVVPHVVGQQHSGSRSPTPMYTPPASSSGHPTADSFPASRNGSVSRFTSARRADDEETNRSLSRRSDLYLCNRKLLTQLQVLRHLTTHHSSLRYPGFALPQLHRHPVSAIILLPLYPGLSATTSRRPLPPQVPLILHLPWHLLPHEIDAMKARKITDGDEGPPASVLRLFQIVSSTL